jgi:hypothetical protein
MPDMTYDIELIELACSEYGFPCRRAGNNELRISIMAGVEMVVANTDDDDTYWGFSDVTWHTHDELALSHGKPGYKLYSPEDMLVAWASGDILLATLVKDGAIIDRWFVHKGNGLDLEHIELGETIQYSTASNQAFHLTAEDGGM